MIVSKIVIIIELLLIIASVFKLNMLSAKINQYIMKTYPEYYDKNIAVKQLSHVLLSWNRPYFHALGDRYIDSIKKRIILFIALLFGQLGLLVISLMLFSLFELI